MTIKEAYKAIWHEVDGSRHSEVFLRRDTAQHAISINNRVGEVRVIDFRQPKDKQHD